MRSLVVLFAVVSLVIARDTNDATETTTTPSTGNIEFDQESLKKQETDKDSYYECEGPWRLQRNILPTHYDLTLQIDPDSPTFRGTVNIDIECVNQTNIISLHSRELNITTGSISVKRKLEVGPAVIISNITTDLTHEMIHINLESDLELGNYVMSFPEFNGTIHEEDNGLFMRTYKEENATRRIIASQLETVTARMVFPCFDEPNLKATFSIRIERPSDYKAFSSMPLVNSTAKSEDTVLDMFETTPVLPTYALAFLVANYSRYPGRELNRTNILVAEQNLDKVDFAYNLAAASLSELESYTKVQYPVSKVDHASVPNFPSAAMENWGLIFYETSYLVDDWKTHIGVKQEGLTLIAHELAHQWFGNMVTTYWWSYLWLNEGFAHFFQYFISDKLLPSWQLKDQLIGLSFQEALIADANPVEPLPPMTSRRCTQQNFSDAFNRISYEKGGNILRMIQFILGEDEFQGAIRLYLQRRPQNAKPADWFQALDDVNAKLNESPLPKNVTFEEFGAGWTEQAGFPVVTATRDYMSSSIYVKQERFFDQRSQNISAEDQDNRWWVPLTWTSASSRSNPMRPQDWLYDDKSVRVYVPKDDWLLFNINAAGFYRVNYDQRNWELLIQGLERSPGDFSVPNRAQLIDDAFALGFAHRLNLRIALSMSRILRNEENVVVWKSGNRHFSNLFNLMASSSAYPKLEKYLQNLMRETYRRVRLDVSATDPHIDRILRESLSPLACEFGLDLCLIDAHLDLTAFFEHVNWKGEQSASDTLHPDVKWAVLCGGIQSGGQPLFDEVRSLAVDPTVQTTNRETYQSALSCTKDFSLLTRHLDDIFNNNTLLSKDQAYVAVQSVIQYPRSFYTGYQFVRNNVNKINRYYNCSTNRTENLVKEITKNIRTTTLYDEVHQWITSSNGDELGNRTALLQNLESIKPEVDWSNESIQQISDWLDTPSTTLPQPIGGGSKAAQLVVPSVTLLFALIVYIRTVL